MIIDRIKKHFVLIQQQKILLQREHILGDLDRVEILSSFEDEVDEDDDDDDVDSIFAPSSRNSRRKGVFGDVGSLNNSFRRERRCSVEARSSTP